MLEVVCECGTRLRLGDEWAGKQGRCPRCDAVLQIPSLPHPVQEPAQTPHRGAPAAATEDGYSSRTKARAPDRHLPNSRMRYQRRLELVTGFAKRLRSHEAIGAFGRRDASNGWLDRILVAPTCGNQS